MCVRVRVCDRLTDSPGPGREWMGRRSHAILDGMQLGPLLGRLDGRLFIFLPVLRNIIGQRIVCGGGERGEEGDREIG